MTEKINLQVSGMTCQHCVSSVKNSVMALEGVEQVFVSLENGSVEVAYENPNLKTDQIAAAIEDQGYDVEAPKE